MASIPGRPRLKKAFADTQNDSSRVPNAKGALGESLGGADNNGAASFKTSRASGGGSPPRKGQQLLKSSASRQGSRADLRSSGSKGAPSSATSTSDSKPSTSDNSGHNGLSRSKESATKTLSRDSAGESSNSVAVVVRQLSKKEQESLKKAEEALKAMRQRALDTQVVLEKLTDELMRMVSIFNKVKGMKNAPKEQEGDQENQPSQATSRRLTVEQRKELLEKGPFNLIFHGVEADWIETEMDDDPEFKKDVIFQKIRTLIKDEVGMARDVGIVDCFRYKSGVPYKGAYPIIVEFKARKEKEQILWRSKDKLRRLNIVVTDDTSSRIAVLRARQERLEGIGAFGGEVEGLVAKPSKPANLIPPETALFADFF